VARVYNPSRVLVFGIIVIEAVLLVLLVILRLKKFSKEMKWDWDRIKMASFAGLWIQVVLLVEYVFLVLPQLLVLFFAFVFSTNVHVSYMLIPDLAILGYANLRFFWAVFGNLDEPLQMVKDLIIMVNKVDATQKKKIVRSLRRIARLLVRRVDVSAKPSDFASDWLKMAYDSKDRANVQLADPEGECEFNDWALQILTHYFRILFASKFNNIQASDVRNFNFHYSTFPFEEKGNFLQLAGDAGDAVNDDFVRGTQAIVWTVGGPNMVRDVAIIGEDVYLAKMELARSVYRWLFSLPDDGQFLLPLQQDLLSFCAVVDNVCGIILQRMPNAT